MALDHEEAQELREVYSNMTGEELRGQLGESADHDALINEILAEGKAVELPGGTAPAPEPEGEPDEEDDAEDEGEEGEEEGEEGAPDAGADAPEQQGDAQPDNTPAEPAPVDQAPAVDVPALDLTPLAEKYDQKLNELQAEKKVKFAAMMAGDLSAEEFSDYEAQYERARDTLRDQKAWEANWHKTVHDFRAANSVGGIDYFGNQEHLDSLDAWVKRLAVKHEGKPESFILNEAHKKVLVEFDIAAPSAKSAAQPAKTSPDAKKVASKTARTPKLSNIPPTLSGLPAAAPAASADGGEFDHLSKLAGYDLERAIARLTPDQRARYEVE